MNENWESMNPSKNTSDGGKKLLHLLKSVEQSWDKKQNASSVVDVATLEADIIDIFSSLRNVYLHQGLLQGNRNRAKDIENLINSKNNNQSSDSLEGKGPKKRKRGRSGGGSTHKDHDVISLLSTDGSSASAGEEGLVLSNVNRVLVPTTNSSSSSSSSDDNIIINEYHPSIIRSATHVIISICQYCTFHFGSSSTTANVEYAILSSISIHILRGLGKTLHSLLSDASCTNSSVDKGNRQGELELAIASCCDCASELIEVANVRLNRSTAIIQSLQNVTKKIIWGTDLIHNKSSNDMIKAAASLFTKLPLTSDSSSTLPTKLWEDGLLSTVSSFAMTLNCFFPITRKLIQNSTHDDAQMQWIKELSTTVTSQSSRMVIFTQRIRGYTSLIMNYLELNSRSICEGTSLIRTFSIPMKSFLELLEIMFTFQTNAESRYFSTKARLRDISTSGGLLSPNAAVTVANLVMNSGFIILDSLLSIIQNSSLQHGKRIVRLSINFLQSCSSNVVRKALNPTLNSNEEKRRMTSSIYLQIKSIRSFVTIMQSIGSSAIVTCTSNVERGLTFTIASLLEQVHPSRKDNGDDQWGSIGEQVELVQVCLDGISTLLSVFGGFMNLQSRQTIESITTMCLAYLENGDGSLLVFRYDCIKISTLRLGMNSMCTPWPDGGASTLVGLLQKMAATLKHDVSSSVSSTAYAVLAACNLCLTPRATPITIVNRNLSNEVEDTEQSGGRGILSSHDSIINDIKRAREEIKTVKMDKTESTKPQVRQKTMKRSDPTMSKSNHKTKLKTGSDVIHESQITKTAESTSKAKLSKEEVVENNAGVDDKTKETETMEQHPSNDKGKTKENKEAIKVQNNAMTDQSTINDRHHNDDKDTNTSMESDNESDDFPHINVDCDPDL